MNANEIIYAKEMLVLSESSVQFTLGAVMLVISLILFLVASRKKWDDDKMPFQVFGIFLLIFSAFFLGNAVYKQKYAHEIALSEMSKYNIHSLDLRQR